MDSSLGNAGEQTGPFDTSNNQLAGASRIHEKAEMNPSVENTKLGVFSDYGDIGIVDEMQSNIIDTIGGIGQIGEEEETSPNLKDEGEFVTVLNSQGLAGTEVDAKKSTIGNFCGATYRKKT